MYPVGVNPDRPAKYQAHLGELEFKGIDFPVKATDVTKFEHQNPSLSVSVFGWNEGLYPIHVSKQEGRAIDLLLIVDGNNPQKTHYVWIKDLARMLFKNSAHDHRQHPCRRCLHVFTTPQLLETHINDCLGIGEKPQRTEMPKDGENILTFTAHHKQMRVPYIIYADFESLNVPIDGCAGYPKASWTRQLAKQTPCGYCYVVVRSDGESTPPVLYRGENAAERFFEAMQNELEIINGVFRQPKNIVMTQEDKASFAEAADCHVCGDPLNGDSVRDHCHITGKYRGAAHNACNLKLRIYTHKTKVPVVFHNLRGYDGYLLMQAIGKVDTKRLAWKKDKTGNWVQTEKTDAINCIPNNMEKYMTFGVGQLQFIDSLQFMNSSLDALVANLQTENLVITSKSHTDTELTLLRRKGIYPYEYVDSFERFGEARLPPKEVFYSHLKREHVTYEDYQHAQRVWEVFDCKTFGDYHDVYLQTDVLLLADVFETFRNTSMTHYGLDPAHYYTAPGMSWDALLKKTRVNLELLTDIDMHLFFEKGLRGGISMVSHMQTKANNPQVEGHDPEKPTSWIKYDDANNLYGWAMNQMLPVGGFEWANPQIDEVLAAPDDAPEGYVLEVDLEYPEHLHDSHSDYPLAPEAMSVSESWISDYQRALVDKLGSKFTKCVKLVPNLYNKERYVLHYRNLKLYHSLGLRVTKIHRAVRFRQEAWMAPYIQLNTTLRAKESSEFEKDFFKLMNNSVFGKTMENLRKRIRVDLIRGDETDKMRRLVADPAYISHKIFNDDLAAVHSVKSTLKLNRPIYVGQAILDISKYRMYDFWYNYLKLIYGEKVQLLYTDTDSLLYKVETENVYEDMRQHAEEYDFSDYPKDHPCYSVENKKVVGKFKDECHSHPIAEFVGLRPKIYSILEANGVNIKKAKGVSKAVVKKDLHHDMYKECLTTREEFHHIQTVIRSHDHQIGVYEQNKVSLSPLDTKKWIAADGITTMAYGHHLCRPVDAVADYLNEICG